MSPALPRPQKTIALIGLMGSGKTSVGKRLAAILHLPFKDADAEIEAAAGRSVTDIFAAYGEAGFRDGERRVISRLLDGSPHVLATGGGAFCQADTRAILKAGALTVWLKADIEILAKRVARRDTRPLLKDKDPLDVLRAQAEVRHPIYAEADLIVETGEGAHQESVNRVLDALKAYMPAEAAS